MEREKAWQGNSPSVALVGLVKVFPFRTNTERMPGKAVPLHFPFRIGLVKEFPFNLSL